MAGNFVPTYSLVRLVPWSLLTDGIFDFLISKVVEQAAVQHEVTILIAQVVCMLGQAASCGVEVLMCELR